MQSKENGTKWKGEFQEICEDKAGGNRTTILHSSILSKNLQGTLKEFWLYV